MFLFILASSLVVNSTALAQDVGFDIDGTLIRTIRAEDRHLESENVISFEGEYYRIMDYVPEVLAQLHRAGLRLFYVSGGEAVRNQYIMDQIYKRVNLYSQQGAAISSAQHGYQLLFLKSRDDLKQVQANTPDAKFTDQYKKDLSVFKGLDHSELIFVDDQRGFAMRDEERHFVWLNNTFFDILDFDNFPVHLRNSKYIPKSYNEWLLERHSILIVAEALLQAQEQKSTGSRFSDLVKIFLFDSKSDLPTSSGARAEALLVAGLERHQVSKSLLYDSRDRKVRTYSAWKSRNMGGVNRCRSVLLAI